MSRMNCELHKRVSVRFRYEIPLCLLDFLYVLIVSRGGIQFFYTSNSQIFIYDLLIVDKLCTFVSH